MRPTILPPSAILAAALTVTACSASFTTSQPAPHPQLHQQHDLHHWGVPGGNYSGITHIGSSRYALVSDKEDFNGWHEIDISFHPSGDIKHVEYIGFHGDTIANVGARDAEGIVYVDNSVFISAENDQQIIEMDMNGRATLRQLEVPPCFGTTKIFGNCGFEALAYDRSQGIFWTTTEQGLRHDIEARTSVKNPVPTLLRLQSFGADLQPLAQYAYRTDAPQTTHATKYYGYGVPSMTVLNDSTLLVMERELYMPEDYDGSACFIKIFSVNTRHLTPLTDTTSLRLMPDSCFAKKELLVEFTTTVTRHGNKDYANYEGMCLGPLTKSGRQTLILVSDSQCRQATEHFQMKDNIRVIVL